ncbi:Gfo/Idh/MocA family oxidoreductase [Marinobacter nanhaiticus D15-8W]|uniref:Gfo/Idh/MocA family oxidoreductase n=1 Tax=Marinobacter nanhaiticus D15-8W TaxID=626887 RepID=N6X463_9GAMM|nr:Gfo/Idh/MocA family oxidoreductase [Marinobacter nanhaiticus]ENO15873.1 gfo/Idh/MocA family oxidoreductase [Marinobacter nanhaiticus D15-8W]BES73269.1 Gfo/Idh/MocA family oxidoreductase [Marinobacter nanhaiticus D15-8W]
MTSTNRIRLGMIGGGQGAFIGGVHRMAARLDDRYELIAGVFSARPDVNRASASELRIDPSRCYDDVSELIAGESGRDDGVQAVAIVTPNHLHFDAAKACLEAGLHVICEKPMTLTADEAETLAGLAQQKQRHLLLTHPYVGYPLVQQARAMVKRGDLGRLRMVNVEYVQEWLAEAPGPDNKQADWRLDPKRAGAAGCLGDIGTHAYQLSAFISGLTLDAVSADLSSMVEGRQLDDNVHAMLRYTSGAKGMLWVSQCAPGFENGLRIRVVGGRASLEWAQESPNELWFAPLNAPRQRITRRDDWLGDDINRGVRIPGGHPEGYIEAFANLYQALADQLNGAPADWLPDANTGVDGLHFISAVLRSNQADGAWATLPPPVGKERTSGDQR